MQSKCFIILNVLTSSFLLHILLFRVSGSSICCRVNADFFLLTANAYALPTPSEAPVTTEMSTHGLVLQQNAICCHFILLSLVQQLGTVNTSCTTALARLLD